MSILDCTPYIVGPSTPVVKQCSACKEWFPATLEHFYGHKLHRDGLDNCCRDCRKAKTRGWYQAHVEEAAEYQKQYRETNKSHLKAYKQQRYVEHGNELRAQKRRSYWRNRDVVRARVAEQYAADAEFREAAKQRARDYSKTEAGRASDVKRRAKRKSAVGTFTAADIEAIRKAQGNRCYLCGKSLKHGYHVDHFIPLSKGGTNDAGNLRLACPKCNQSKHAKHPFELGRLL